MAATASIRIVKSSEYKGGTRLWSNRYHFDGTTPPDSSHWTTLADAVVAAEKAQWDAQCTIVEAVGYAPGSDVPVFSKTYSVAGTSTWSSGANIPLECCALVRFTTTQRTSKNHPVYLFNYVHRVRNSGTSDYEQLNTDQKAAIETYATAWITGFSDGAVTHHRAGPNGAVAQTRLVDAELTHRDFPK